MAMLALFGFNGEYGRRLNWPRWVGQVEPVGPALTKRIDDAGEALNHPDFDGDSAGWDSCGLAGAGLTEPDPALLR
jgi:hypothetical protein